MKTAEQWFEQYGQTHQNPVNICVHKVCVPLIFWAVFAILWVVPIPPWLSPMNWSEIALTLVLIFYLSLGFIYFVKMLGLCLLIGGINWLFLDQDWPLGPIALGVFVLAWVGQFYGHRVEGKRPAFFEDLLFLLIGPLWVMGGSKKSFRRRANERRDF